MKFISKAGYLDVVSPRSGRYYIFPDNVTPIPVLKQDESYFHARPDAFIQSDERDQVKKQEKKPKKKFEQSDESKAEVQVKMLVKSSNAAKSPDVVFDDSKPTAVDPPADKGKELKEKVAESLKKKRKKRR